MDKDLFAGLDDLGFSEIEEVDLFKRTEELSIEAEIEHISMEEKERSLLYEREIICPVCGKKFAVKAIKKSSNKVTKRDTDFFVHYNLINPYFYEVWLCNSCGYAALSVDFGKIKTGQVPLVKQKVTPRWQGKVYPEIFDVHIAIERYKLALLNAFFIEDVASKKAFICLKTAWMYRLLNDQANEITFLKQTIEGFEHAYSEEKFPFYEMDEFMVQYLLGELYRRIGNDDKALSWFGKVITSYGAKQKIKDKARDQRDLINEARLEAERAKHLADEAAIGIDDRNDGEENDQKDQRKGFFTKFFNK